MSSLRTNAAWLEPIQSTGDRVPAVVEMRRRVANPASWLVIAYSGGGFTCRPTIAENLAGVRERIAAAAHAAAEIRQPITLVAVTKYATTESIAALIQAGCRDLGESRPQQLWQRAAEFADSDVRWHMIGHLQRNKVARTVPLVSLVHSCDSLRIADGDRPGGRKSSRSANVRRAAGSEHLGRPGQGGLCRRRSAAGDRSIWPRCRICGFAA